MSQVHQEPSQRKTEDVATEVDVPKSDHKSADELKAELDALLDDIDSVLEENAQEFVDSYVQKGGE